MKNQPPNSLGLGGDGEEIAAIEEVERHFGINLDYTDADRWITVGDVYATLLKQLPPDRAAARDTWAIFADAISRETGVNSSAVIPDTLLLGQGGFDRRIALGIACVAGIAIALVHFW